MSASRITPENRALLEQSQALFKTVARKSRFWWCINPDFDTVKGGYSPGMRPLGQHLNEDVQTMASRLDRFERLEDWQVGRMIYDALENVNHIAKRQRLENGLEKRLPSLVELDALRAKLEAAGPLAPTPPKMGSAIKKPGQSHKL